MQNFSTFVSRPKNFRAWLEAENLLSARGQGVEGFTKFQSGIALTLNRGPIDRATLNANTATRMIRMLPTMFQMT